MPRFPQPESYLPQPPSSTPCGGEPRFLDQIPNTCRLKHFSYRTEQSYAAEHHSDKVNLTLFPERWWTCTTASPPGSDLP